ncbi:unnamed protein product [Effrenium voratum]|uniref:tRNA (cytosine(38)-C(5))-methyltransferase n=1 Tax=Effrenium voratum TaxID=2562239 RepID=A0AA36NGG6_9DINO|nr:unnamed protein product [Effrenium voratum]
MSCIGWVPSPALPVGHRSPAWRLDGHRAAAPRHDTSAGMQPAGMEVSRTRSLAALACALAWARSRPERRRAGPSSARRALRVHEFFSGVGGLRLAFQAAGGRSARWRAYEVDEACCQAYRQLYHSRQLGGVRQAEPWKSIVRPEDELWRCSIDKLPDAAFEKADLWIMSPPCQPFTRTGHRLDVKDPRCRALLRLVEALPKLRVKPKGILLENVPGFQNSEAHKRLCAALREAGLEWQELLLDPRSFGFPNTRQRFYLVATAAEVDLEELGGVPVRPVKDFLRPVAPEDLEALRVPRQFLQEAHEEKWQLDVATGESLATKTFTSSYGKVGYGAEGLSKAGPLLDMLGKDGKRFRSLPPEHWDHVRYFAPEELALLMGFPNAFALPEMSTRTQWRLLGNSVNVAVVTALLRRLLRALGEAPEAAEAAASAAERPLGRVSA